ncbi:MAG: NAD-dependent epimerase/dehydratase family protein [Candidatus Micrarchaeota archaeon]
MILVTGGTGFLGKALVPELEKIDDVRVMSRGEKKDSFSGFSGAEIVKADITDKKQVAKAMKGADYVFHLAKFKGHNYPYEKHYPTTVLGTRNVVECAVKEDVEKLIHMSSAGVEMKNITPYSAAKEEAEVTVMRRWHELTMPIIRSTMIYDRSVIKKLNRYTYLPFPHVKQKVHMAYKGAVVRALVNAMKYGKSDVYYALDKRSIMLTQLMKEIASPRPVIPIPAQTIYLLAALGYPVKYIFNAAGAKPPFTPEFVRYTFEDRSFDIAKSVKILKYNPVDTIDTVKKIKRGEPL